MAYGPIGWKVSLGVLKLTLLQEAEKNLAENGTGELPVKTRKSQNREIKL